MLLFDNGIALRNARFPKDVGDRAYSQNWIFRDLHQQYSAIESLYSQRSRSVKHVTFHEVL
ncbi:hypothetical protein F7734_19075 [Scytonema sp. UIC 10036]|uniref:hypothetical protein n=1 Tax=Scytonema sp. UIC 10036 TaxID=2304196 RepID=UPI0012DAC1B4|nr:hypothetical protein [Scytonema sp. UIC 10036]MUG94364.1 hypothetical protein [Scytonema sp. UIC 10036]